jgi:hypothetical protein
MKRRQSEILRAALPPRRWSRLLRGVARELSQEFQNERLPCEWPASGVLSSGKRHKLGHNLPKPATS